MEHERQEGEGYSDLTVFLINEQQRDKWTKPQTNCLPQGKVVVTAIADMTRT